MIQLQQPHRADLYDVTELVPHRAGMLWINQVLRVDNDSVSALAVISEDKLFLRDGVLPVWAGVEFMAQTVAAWSGFHARERGRAVSVGFLVGSRRFEANCQQFAVGQTLRIDATKILIADNGLGMFDCSIYIDSVVAATAMLSVYEPADESALVDAINGVR